MAVIIFLPKENLTYIEKQIERISKEVRKMYHRKPWADSMTYLMQLPGFGVITATPALHQTQCGASVTILAAIGDVQRFETPKHLASYSGTNAWVGAKWHQEPRQGNYKRRADTCPGVRCQGRTSLGLGGSSAASSEV
jgi:hypothetical protein